jgi:periplasmic protein CpxP/Spy
MKSTIVTLATLLAAAGIANAQTTSPSSPSATTPPSPGSTSTMPGSGSATGTAGAMTESAVKSKIEASGYNNVTGIKKDSTGDWTAKASKGGKQVAVMVDAKGTVKEAQQ